MTNQPLNLPQVGDTITIQLAIVLCKHFQLLPLVTRITANPQCYKDWIFDGASLLPDTLFSKLFHIPHLAEIALKHDLKYAYGELDNDAERYQADLTFRQELLNDGANPLLAWLMYKAVRIAGGKWLHTSFSWGFAKK